VDLLADTSCSMAGTPGKVQRRMELVYLFSLLACKLHARLRLFKMGGRLEAIKEPLVRPLLIAFLVLLLIEVAEPRFGLLGIIQDTARRARARAREMRRRMRLKRPRASSSAGSRAAGRPGVPPPEPHAGGLAPPAEEATAQAGAAAPAGDLDYLGKSKLQSRGRPRNRPK